MAAPARVAGPKWAKQPGTGAPARCASITGRERQRKPAGRSDAVAARARRRCRGAVAVGIRGLYQPPRSRPRNADAPPGAVAGRGIVSSGELSRDQFPASFW